MDHYQALAGLHTTPKATDGRLHSSNACIGWSSGAHRRDDLPACTSSHSPQGPLNMRTQHTASHTELLDVSSEIGFSDFFCKAGFEGF